MADKKTICVGLPCYNEEDNIEPLYLALVKEFNENLPEYNYLLQFIDNCSTDGTRKIIEKICREDKCARAIFNAKNYGPDRSASHNLCQMEGDCAILMATDFQTPVNMISRFVHEWENGALIVAGIKKHSKENPIMFAIRGLYYKILNKFSFIEQIEQFTGFGLYDKVFLDFFKTFDDPFINLRGLVAEYGYKIKYIEFVQSRRRSGKSKNNFWYLYDLAMYNFVTYTIMGVRIATFLGILGTGISSAAAIFCLIYKALHWSTFSVGTILIIIGMFFIGAVQLTFLGFLGEYVLSINSKLNKKPRVMEEKRINFNR